jgi:succinate dehydrogenase / fumarate reductase membrane anchor subunit
MSILNPLRRVRGLGSAKSGTEDWWYQRVTSVALVPLSVFLVVLMVSLIGADHAMVVARLGHPLVAVGLILTLVTLAWHMQIGMRVIIEDYIDAQVWKVSALIANAFFAVVVAVLGVFAVLTISFGGLT